ncbi:MAG: amidohydrolase family protein [Bacteroidetes bacterium]|nr:amidohydrolase family protein [Bacteroidota bacterium]
MKHLFLVALMALSTLSVQAQETFSATVDRLIDYHRGLVALENVTVFDGTGAAARTGQTIIINGGTIQTVGSSTEVIVPEGAIRVDLKGHTVTPGLVGLHNHTFYTTSQRNIQLNYSAPMLYLASGVTTIRTTGSVAPYSEINLRASIESGEAAGPYMFITGPYLRGDEAWLQGPEDAARVTAYWGEEGVDWMKVYTQVTRDELKAIVKAAHAKGVKVTGHLCSISHTEAVELGIDSIEHDLSTNTDYVKDKEPDKCPTGPWRAEYVNLDLDSEEVQHTFRTMIDNGIGRTTTPAVFEMYVQGRPMADERSLAAMSPETREEYLATYQHMSANGTPVDQWNKSLAYDLAFYRAGGLLAAGVDPTGYGGALPGYGDQRNYQLLLEAGFTPAEAVQISTLNGAKILGIEDETGSIVEGKRADLVVFEGDLISDDTTITRARIVFKDGVGFNSGRMEKAVEGNIGVR